MANVKKTQVVLPASPAYDDAARKRQMADALLAQSQAPRPVMAAPTWTYAANGLTQLGEALLARNAGKKASKAEAAADSQMRMSNANAIEQLAGATQIDAVDGEAPTPLATGTIDQQGNSVDPNQANIDRLAEAKASQSGLHAAIDPMDQRKGQEVLAQALLQRSMPVYMDPDKKAQRELTKAQLDATVASRQASLEESRRASQEREKIQREGIQAGRDKALLEAKTKLQMTGMRARNAAASASAVSKSLPPAIYKIVDEASQAISTANGADSIIQTALDDLKKVDLGAANNLFSRVKNMAGASDPASRAYVGIKQGFEKLRNNYLLLAKGVQTEGDATRAWNSEIGQDVQYDNDLAQQQLMKAQTMISDMLEAQSNRIESAYATYGAARPAASRPSVPAPTPNSTVPSFATEAEAQAAGIKPGTKVIIGGVPGTWQ